MLLVLNCPNGYFYPSLKVVLNGAEYSLVTLSIEMKSKYDYPLQYFDFWYSHSNEHPLLTITHHRFGTPVIFMIPKAKWYLSG
jgi:hypothetical protein